jgi:hypothetical protein
MDAAQKASSAVKDSARKYLDAAGINFGLEDIEKTICERPFSSLALATGTGLVIGVVLATGAGLALLGLFGRKAAVEAATSFGRPVSDQAVDADEVPPVETN